MRCIMPSYRTPKSNPRIGPSKVGKWMSGKKRVKNSPFFPNRKNMYQYRKIDNPNFVILIDYIPFDGTDGRGVFDTRHASRTLEVGVSYIFVLRLLS
jgi:hypothetical protein